MISAIKKDKFFEVKLVVGGSHLEPQFGLTKNEIIEDGHKIDFEIPYISSSSTSSFQALKDLSILQNKFSAFLESEKPDACLVLGDRSELIPVAFSCLMTNTPLLHISGGEVTEGAIDNQIRHALSKIANLHFASTEECKLNLLKLAEEEWRIAVTGEPALDYIIQMPKINKNELFEVLKLQVDKKVILCTFHPETISQDLSADFIQDLIVDVSKKFNNYQILITASNNDIGGLEINQTLSSLSKIYSNIYFIESLGQKKYYSILEYTDLMLGNSSSGIIEAQSFAVPVVNVGGRQQGRIRNTNTLDADIDKNNILMQIEVALSENFKKSFSKEKNIYGNGNASAKIIDFIKTIFDQYSIKEILIKKSNF